MLEKQKFAFKNVDFAEVNFNGQVIKIKPYLSLTDQAALLSVYLEEYFSKEESRIVEAEYKIVLGVLDFCTNIEISDLKMNDLFANYKLWDEIKKKISNYGEFRALVARTVDEIKETKRIEKSLGSVLEGIFDKLSNLLNSDISPESIEKVQQLLKQVEESKIFKTATEIYKDK